VITPTTSGRLLALAFLAALGFFALPAISFAQDEVVPPPPTIISKQEREKLDVLTRMGDRTKLALQLMGGRIVAAEALNGKQDYDGAFRELGGFHGLMNYTIGYLLDADRRGIKVLDDLKRFEIGVRGFGPRIEGIRRELPVDRDDYMGALLKQVREARAKAADALFDDSVLKTQFTSRSNE
jgi:hypothetical protein